MRRTVLLLSVVGAMLMMYAVSVLATHIPPDLTIDYHYGPVKVQPGETWVGYDAQVTNKGGRTAALPAGTVVAKHTVVGATAMDYCYAPSGYSCNDTGNGTFEIVSQGANTLGVGQSLSLYIVVTAPTTDGKMTHSVTVDPSGTTEEFDENNNASDTIATYVGTPPPTDLSVTQTDNADPVDIGNWLEYTVKVTNNGQDTAFNVSVDDILPGNVTYSGGSSSCNYIASENAVICPMGDIVSGASKEFTLYVTPKAAGTITNTATVFSDSDPDSSNDTSKQDTVVSPPPDTVLPTVSAMSPRNASFTTDRTPTIKATVRDNVTNLQKANIKLYVNGVLISPTKYSYSASTDVLVYNSPRIAKGKKTVRIVATDAAKNVRSASWYFTIR